MPRIGSADVVGGASYEDGEAMRRAFDGAETVFLVAGGHHLRGDRER